MFHYLKRDFFICTPICFFFFRILSLIHTLHVLYLLACWARMTKKPRKITTKNDSKQYVFVYPTFLPFIIGLLWWSIFVGLCCVLILRGLRCFCSEWVARKNTYITSFLFPWWPLVSCVLIWLYMYIYLYIIIYHDTNKALTMPTWFDLFVHKRCLLFIFDLVCRYDGISCKKNLPFLIL